MVRLVRFKTPDALGNVMVEPATATSAPSGCTIRESRNMNMQKLYLFHLFQLLQWVGHDGNQF